MPADPASPTPAAGNPAVDRAAQEREVEEQIRKTWGGKAGSAQTTVAESVRPVPQAPRSTACPSCGSADSQSLPAAFAAGTSTINSKSSGGALALGPGNRMVPVLTSSSSSGTQQTALAKLCSPPAKPGRATAMGCLAALCGIGMMIGLLVGAMSEKDNAAGLFIGPSVALVLGIAFVISVMKATQFSKADTKKWNRDTEAWKARWICLRCNHIYTPNR